MWIKRVFYILFAITIFCAGTSYLSGCAMKKPGSDDINRQISVFNIALFAPASHSPINGVGPRREECVSGYEFYYDDLDILASYHRDDRVFRITTRNKKTSMFGIAPGDSFALAKERISRLGFSQGYTPYKFVKGWCLFTLLVDEKNTVFGMTVEVLN
ncbi:hypothetical protein EG832_07440 [bacterium]|nr:hypothetical protein [bacterium]